MKVSISNGLRGKKDPKEYHLKCREVVKRELSKMFPDETIEIISVFFDDFNGNRLQFLGKSIMEELAFCDVAVFRDDWQNYDGCRSEQFIASQYKKTCIYLRTE